MKLRGLLSPAAMIVAILALALGSVGTATADAISVHTVKHIAKSVVKNKAPFLSVAHADTATSATTAATAANANTLNGFQANQLVRATSATGAFTGFGTLATFVFTDLVTKTITAPTSGILVLEGTAPFNQLNGNANAADVNFRIAVDGTAATVVAPGHDANVSGVHSSVTVSGGIAVAAGTHTVALQAQNQATGGSFIGIPSVTVLFVPFGSTGGQGALAQPNLATPGNANR